MKISFSDISGATMFQDMDKLICGVFIMVFYVQFIISKYNCIENRVSDNKLKKIFLLKYSNIA